MHLNAAQDEESKNFRRCWGEEKNVLFACHRWEKITAKYSDLAHLIVVI